MLVFLFGMLVGGGSLGLVEYQTAYCDCYRASFVSESCQKIKGSGIQGSCHN